MFVCSIVAFFDFDAMFGPRSVTPSDNGDYVFVVKLVELWFGFGYSHQLTDSY